MIELDLLVEPFAGYPRSRLALTPYPTGNWALVGVDEHGEITFCASVNLAPYGSRPLQAGEMWLKGWGENEGLPRHLQAAGAIILTGERMRSGYGEAELALLDDRILQQLRDYERQRQRGRGP